MGARLKGDEAWLEALDGVSDAAADISPAGEEIHDRVLADARKHRIPVVTGRLRASQTDPSHPDHIFEALPRRVTVATRDPAGVFNPQYVAPIDSGALVDLLADHVIGGADDD